MVGYGHGVYGTGIYGGIPVVTLPVGLAGSIGGSRIGALSRSARGRITKLTVGHAS